MATHADQSARVTSHSLLQILGQAHLLLFSTHRYQSCGLYSDYTEQILVTYIWERGHNLVGSTDEQGQYIQTFG